MHTARYTRMRMNAKCVTAKHVGGDYLLKITYKFSGSISGSENSRRYISQVYSTLRCCR